MPRKRWRPSVSADFAARVRRTLGPLPQKGVSSEADKLSVALETLIAPFMDEGLHLEGLQILTLLGAVAWNAHALGPAGARLLLKTRIELGRGRQPAEVKPLLDLLDSLCRRKRELFPDDRRIIVEHEVKDTGQGYRLQVAGILPSSDPAET